MAAIIIKPRQKNLDMARIIAQQIYAHDPVGLTVDANDLTALFANELEFVDQELQVEKFAPLKAQELVPFWTAGGPGVEKVKYRKVKELGQAKIIGKQTTELPLVDVVGEDFEHDVQNLADMYRYTVFELKNSAQNPSIRLETERKKNALNAIMRLHDRICMVGDTDLGWTGFVNDANATLVGSLTGDWDGAATPVQIVDDISSGSWGVFELTKENYEADTMAVPTTLGPALDRPIGDNADKTIRSYILENSPHIKRIIMSHHLNTASETNGQRVVIYKRSPDVLRYGANQSFEELPPQHEQLHINVPCIGRTSGFQLRQPLAVAYLDLN